MLYVGLGLWAAAGVVFVVMLPRHGVERFRRVPVLGFIIAACMAGAVMAGLIIIVLAAL